MDRRQLLAGGLGLAALSAAGCSKVKALTLRERISRGLRSDSMLQEALSDPAAEVQPVACEALPQWQIVDITYNGASHPLRWFVAVTRDDEPAVVVLSGFPERWAQITTGAAVDSASTAEAVAKTWFDSTRSMGTLGYRVESADDIAWPSKPGPEVERARKRVADTYPLGAPKAEADGDDWRMTLWTMENQTLLEHTLTVSAGALVTDKAVKREEDLPAAIGI